MVSTTTSASPESIIDVLPEARVVRDGADTLDSSRQLTVSLASASPSGGFSPFSGWAYKTKDTSSTILVEHGSPQNNLSITLHRTIRVPDNADTNSLPPSLGSFPLFRVSDYAHNLPDELAQKGGIFFPMYQSEAMWMAFRSSRPFALKIYVGGVNAVSGFPMVENDQTREKRSRMLKDGKQIQDYLVAPEQPWIDGIVSEDGKIRQFVAQPKGSGFSVEAQVTGEEKIGGIQIEIIPIKKNFPDEFDVRFQDKEGKVLTRTIKLQESGLTRESSWADVKKLIRNEFDIAIQDQQLDVHPSRSSHIDFGDTVKLGDVYFPPRFSTISVTHKPEQPLPDHSVIRRRMVAGGVPGSFGGGGLFGSAPPAPAPPPSAPVMAMAACFGGPAAPAAKKMAEAPSGGNFGAPPASDQRSLTKESAAMPLHSETHSRTRSASKPVVRAKVKEMGLAAGGLIKQSINADPNPADIWDEAAAVLLNLQIFDPASYCAITGNPAPSTPATQAEYAKHGWPYFELWNEEKTGIKGDFSEVKSVAQLKKERALAAGQDAPVEEESVPVRVVTIGKGRVLSFTTTFKPLEVLRKEVEHLTLNG